MKKLKVTTIVGTRPEIIRLSRVINKLDIFCEHTLVHTGQNYDYELNEIFFEELGIRTPDIFLNVAGKTSAETIGNVIVESDKVLNDIKPDALLILGDTNSCMSAIAAKRQKVPIFHMEAGNRCFDLRVPEEINRKIVDHISDINLTYSSIAREYLLREGLVSKFVIKTGSPMLEVLNYYKKDIASSSILEKLGLDKHKYFVISFHREENIDSDQKLSELVNTLNKIDKTFKLPIIFSTHPRTKKRLDELNLSFSKNIVFSKPFGFLDYNKLQIHAKAVLSDSGTINEESSILNFPALNLRDSHERPEGMEEAAVMMVGTNETRIMQGINILESQSRDIQRTIMEVQDYSYPNISEKIVRIILSYIDVVNYEIWKK